MTEGATPPTRNEAAERLRLIYPADAESMLIDAALAEERRHVIEQIRERMEALSMPLGWTREVVDHERRTVYAILDDLSTPEQK